uniref:Uncharacterized protein n=1 Tax=viral metagenome TaxID=1070528 RepID=A0A6C0BLT3_9ZZZZ
MNNPYRPNFWDPSNPQSNQEYYRQPQALYDDRLRAPQSFTAIMNPTPDLPEPPRIEPLSELQRKKAAEMGVSIPDARMFLAKMREAFNAVAVTFNGTRKDPYIAMYYDANATVPQIVMRLAEQSEVVGGFNIVQIPYNEGIKFASNYVNITDILK